MAYLGTEKLKELIQKEKVIQPNPDLNRVICGAYELSLGNEVFKTDSKVKKKEFLNQPNEQVTINPGQFALLLTQETVSIPIHKIAFISIKAGIKLKGLINVSGFHVDPGFAGNLVFSVYNAGASPISILKGEPCFLIWFADLELIEDELTSYEKGSHEHKHQDTIPSKYIDALIAGELASPNALSKRIDEVKHLKNTNEWILRILLGIAIAIGIKLWWDNYDINKAIEYGYNKKAEEIKSDSGYIQIHNNIDTLSHRTDTLTGTSKQILDSTK